MRTLPTLACVSMMTLLAACGQSDGYYDTNGDYRYYNTDNATAHGHDITLRDHMRNENYARNYNRRGYYDADGAYIDSDEDNLNVPTSMFPPRGMCRVWYMDRDIAGQPPVKSCNRIRTRLPAGAYVIYGG